MTDNNQYQSQHDRWVFVGLLALLFFAPLPFGSKVVTGWAVLVVWSSLLLFAWLLLWLSGRASLSISFRNAWPVLVVLLLWLIWTLLQITPMPFSLVKMLSPVSASVQHEAVRLLESGESKMAIISLSAWATESAIMLTLMYITAFVLTLLLVTSHRRLKILVWVLVCSGLFQALYGILMTLTGVEQIFFYQKKAVGLVTGTYINRNHLAGYLVICLSLGIGLMLGLLSSERATSWRSWLRSWLLVVLSPKLRLRLFLVIMVIALVMTRSRMGNVSFFAALLVTGILGLILLRHARRSMTVLIISLIIIDILMIGTWFGVDQVMQRLEQSFVQTDHEEAVQRITDTDIYVTRDTVALTEDRGKVYRDMHNYWHDFWLTGSGMGSFRYVFPMYAGQDIRNYYDHAHRDYYEFAVEGGIAGILLPGFLVLYPLLVAVKAMRRRHDKLMQGIAFGAVMSIIALMIHSSVDFNLQIPANALTFMVVLALALISANMPSGNKRVKGT